METHAPAARGRWLLVVAGGIAAGVILAFSVVGSANFNAGSMGAGQDARAYWLAVRDANPYGAEQGEFGAYLYSPAFLQLLNPIVGLPWQQFLAGWTALLMAALLLLTGPLIFAVALPLAFFEIWGGNIHLLLALTVVVGFRWPAAWAFVALTKVTPGIGLLWFAVRGEWRNLAIALGATGAIVAGSFVVDPQLWGSWLSVLAREAADPLMAGGVPAPLTVRLPVAAALCAYAARTDRRWLLPVVVMLALPVLWWGSLSLLLGSVALERRRVETALAKLLARTPRLATSHASPRRQWIAEPEG